VKQKGNPQGSRLTKKRADAILLSVPDAAALLGIGERTLKKLIADREIRSTKINGRRLLRRVTLEQFAARREAGTSR